MPGTILMTPETVRLAEGYVQVKPLGPVIVKGLNEPIEVYEITGAGPVRSRLQAAAARGLTRFVGRTAEFETLCQALDRAKAGHGQVVALVGEPGVGKSRLFWEFTHSRRTVDWLIVESGSVSYGKATAYLPIADLLKAYFAIEDRDDVRKIREKVTGKLLTLDKSLEPALPAFLALLDVPVEDDQWQSLDPSQRRQLTLGAVKRLLLRESQVQPLLLVFEDLHWIDSETQAVLDSLVQSLPTARMLVLVNYRPEYQHDWVSKTYYSQLRIDPLPTESAADLLQALMGDDTSLLPLKPLLIERTEGNPFFLEEIVRDLIETKVLTGEPGNYSLAKAIEHTQVPATVQAVLAARIDRLPPEEKHLLQSAAVIGKDVPFVLLQAIAHQSEEELRRGIALLQAAEFIYETSLFPDLEHTFKHALTHEVAYGSVLHGRRRALHARIVEAIERLYPDRLLEQVERIAHHALSAELWEKAVEYLHQAGKKAAARSANPEAITWFERALEVLEQIPENQQTIAKGIDIRVDFGPALIAKSGFAALEVEENYTQALTLCEQLEGTPQLFPVLWGLARMHDLRGELKIGRNLGKQLLDIAERLQEPALLLEAHHELWANMSMLGELIVARSHLEQGFVLYDLEKHRHHAFLYGGHDPGVCCGYHATQVFWLLGYPDQALQKSNDCLILARKLAHSFTITNALFFSAWLHQHRGEMNMVQARIEEGMTLANEQGFPRWIPHGTFLRGWLLHESGERLGLAEMAKVLASELTKIASGRWDGHYAVLLAAAHRKSGSAGEGLNVLLDALARVQQTECRYYEAELYRMKGELLLMQGVPSKEQAEACFQNALNIARRQSAKSLELRAAMSLCRLWQRQGKQAPARQLLGEIYGWFTEGFDTADLKAAKALLEDL
jgi:predicted ATPase